MKVIALLLEGDLQSESLKNFFDVTFYWKDFQRTWTFLSRTNGPCFYDLINKVEITLEQETKIYLRGPGLLNDGQKKIADLIFCLARFAILGFSKKDQDVLNKLTPLRLFGEYAPQTKVLKGVARERNHRGLIKGISSIPNQVQFLQIKGSEELDLPTQVQSRALGQEYKINALIQDGKLTTRCFKIVSSEVDYRYATTTPTIELCHEVPKAIEDLLWKVYHEVGSEYFDVDYFISATGKITVLEWNNSPAPTPLELAHGVDFHLLCELYSRHEIVGLSAREDNLIESMRFDLKEAQGRIVHLRLEDLLKTWSFTFCRGELCFFIQTERRKMRLYPKAVYLRSANFDQKNKLGAAMHFLMTALECWPGTCLGKMETQFRNGSKALQMSTSLKEALEREGRTVKIPQTRIIKGGAALLTKVLEALPESIVKSLSSVRSVVCDQKTFTGWNPEGLAYLPTMFQEKIEGMDLRVHFLKDGSAWSSVIKEKDAIDYRYALNRSAFADYTAPENVLKFSQRAASVENNPLVGLDFLVKGEVHYCLEINPGPGWNWYYNRKTCTGKNHFAHHLYEVLNG